MKAFTSYRREVANTITGEAIIVTTIYSSFDKGEIDQLDKFLKETIKSGVAYELKEKEE